MRRYYAGAVIDKMNNGLSAQDAKELLDQTTFRPDGSGGETLTSHIINRVSEKDPDKGRKLNLNTLR